MNNSFINTVEKLSDDLYMITETRSIHCYLLIGTEKALLIDTGWGYEDPRPILEELTDKPVMTVFTHGDGDHCLGARYFDEVFIHPLDYGKMRRNDTGEERRGMLEHRLRKLPELASHMDTESYCRTLLPKDLKVGFLSDGEIIDLGGKYVECVLTPGHSYGHLMFLEKESGRLFSGDQIMDGHNIWHFLKRDEQAGFAATLSSLKHLAAREREISAIFPAHGRTPVKKQCLFDLIECLECELRENYQNDIPFHSHKGDGYQHFFRSVNLIYSDERLEEYLGNPVYRD